KRQPQILVSVLVLANRRHGTHTLQNCRGALLHIAMITEFDPHAVGAVSAPGVKRHSSAVRSTPSECRQHAQHGRAECGTPPASLVKVPHNAAHDSLLLSHQMARRLDAHKVHHGSRTCANTLYGAEAMIAHPQAVLWRIFMHTL